MRSGNDTWQLEFARSATKRRAENEFHRRQRDERKDRSRASDKAEDGVADLAAVAVVATESQIDDFNTTLDQYDTAVIEALDQNRRELEQVRARLDVMLEQAYVLDDGRRVFEGEDGTVIDEFGELVSSDIITAEEIPDHLPSSNNYLAEMEYETALDEKRTELLDLQGQLDDAREAGAEEGVTSDRLDQILDDLALDAPIEVQVHMPGYSEPEVADAQSDFASAAADPSVATRIPSLDAPILTH